MKRTKKIVKALLDIALVLILSYLVHLDGLSVFEAVILVLIYMFIGETNYEIKLNYGERENRDNSTDSTGIDKGVND